MNKDAEDKCANRMVRVTVAGTQDMTAECTQLDQTNGISNETLAIPNATATPTQISESQCQLHMMNKEESMLPKEAYDALEHKRTLRLIKDSLRTKRQMTKMWT